MLDQVRNQNVGFLMTRLILLFSHAAAYAKTDASAEAIKLLNDVFGYRSYSGDITAAFAVPRPKPLDPYLSTTSVNIKTIKDGMEQIPKSLMEQFLATSSR